MYVISKILSFITSPLSWVFLTLAIGTTLHFVKRKKALVWFLSSFILTVVFTNPLLSNWAMHRWEKSFAKPEIHHSKATAIVLSGMASYNDQNQQHNFGQSTDRLTETVKLYFDGKISKIILTGGNASIFYNDRPESEYLKEFLIQLKIPDSVILTETQSRNTYENALFTKHITDSLCKTESYLLITSAYHMRRALACFKSQKISITPYAVDVYHPYIKTDYQNIIAPSTSALQQWNILFHEWIGLLYYSIRGYI